MQTDKDRENSNWSFQGHGMKAISWILTGNSNFKNLKHMISLERWRITNPWQFTHENHIHNHIVLKKQINTTKCQLPIELIIGLFLFIGKTAHAGAACEQPFNCIR